MRTSSDSENLHSLEYTNHLVVELDFSSRDMVDKRSAMFKEFYFDGKSFGGGFLEARVFDRGYFSTGVWCAG